MPLRIRKTFTVVSSFIIKFNLLYVYEGLPGWINLCTTSVPGAHRSPKKASYPLELELTWDLCKSSKCSLILSHLSRLLINFKLLLYGFSESDSFAGIPFLTFKGWNSSKQSALLTHALDPQLIMSSLHLWLRVNSCELVLLQGLQSCLTND